MIYKNYIFDLDDTLLVCGKYYTQAKEQFAEVKSNSTGLAYSFCLKILNEIDISCTVFPDAFTSGRFPTSFAAASVALDTISKRSIDYEEAETLRTLANEVFTAPYEPIEGAIETLKYLKENNYNIYVVTKGEEWVQLNKLLRSGIYDIVGSDNIAISLKKTPETLLDFMSEREIPIDDAVMVGDSLRDDIGSAYAIGMDSILIKKQLDSGWVKYEQEIGVVVPTHHLNRVAEILQHV